MNQQRIENLGTNGIEFDQAVRSLKELYEVRDELSLEISKWRLEKARRFFAYDWRKSPAIKTLGVCPVGTELVLMVRRRVRKGRKVHILRKILEQILCEDCYVTLDEIALVKRGELPGLKEIYSRAEKEREERGQMQPGHEVMGNGFSGPGIRVFKDLSDTTWH